MRSLQNCAIFSQGSVCLKIRKYLEAECKKLLPLRLRLTDFSAGNEKKMQFFFSFLSRISYLCTKIAKKTTMKKFFTIFLLFFLATDSWAVLKEENLEQTLGILRTELVGYYQEMSRGASLRRAQNDTIISQLIETNKRANQNALMLYSQNADYVFDLTYACHEATEQYRQFQQSQLPFRKYIEKVDGEIAKYDSLTQSLQSLRTSLLTRQGLVDRSVCLTLAVSISHQLQEERDQMAEYVEIYQRTEQRLKTLNDYALRRYNDIQTSIFRNGGDNYVSILTHMNQKWQDMTSVVKKKYSINTENHSQWNVLWIISLFVGIMFCAVVVILLNQLVFRYLLPKRFQTERFMRKRTPIIMATTVITFALSMGLITNTADQNFLVMASDLLVEYGWLLGVILISLLLRVDASQVMSAVRIYSPLIVVGFIVIVFRIILIPSELVNIVFPPILLFSTLWQWNVIHRHNQNIPRSDIFYTYISLTVFLISLVCSMIGYTLLSVQLLIWWLMQLTCTLTITCVSLYVKRYGERHGFEEKPVTQAWGYRLLQRVALPTLSVLSVMVSIYWAAEVFNLSDLCWRLFNRNFINLENLQVSIVKLSIVVCLWFLFSYIATTVLQLMRMHYQVQDPTTAASREVMGKNVVQVVVWGAWLLISLSLLHISVAWLLAISGGLSTGIGFASKDIIENIYYGASLMAGRVKVGDWIEVDGTMGKVSSISYTSTVVESLYGEVITFQNSQLFAKNYKNLTRNHGYILALVPFGVAYGAKVSQVKALVEQAVQGLHHPWTDQSKQVKVVMTEMADSSVNFKLIVWVDAVKKIHVISDIMACIYDTLGQNGIEIPFPQRDIHIIN